MRLLVLSLAVLASNTLRVCDSSDDGAQKAPEVSAEAKAQGQASASAKLDGSVNAEIGGNLVAIGDHVVELLVHRQGLVEATVRTKAGATVAPANVDLSATLRAKAGAQPKLKLAWDPLTARFRGRADAQAELVAEPIDVTLSVDGAPLNAKLEHYALLNGPDFGGQLVSAGEYGAEVVVDADGLVTARLRSATGAEIKGGGDLAVAAEATAEGGAKHTIALAYSAPDLAFKGRAKAGVKIAPGPFKLVVTAGGKAHAGGLGRVALRANASHGGRVAVVGDYSVELVAEGPRVIAAYVFDASGKATGRADLKLALALGLDGTENLSLEWDAPSASYRAELKGKADYRAEPIRLSLHADGRAHFGALASFTADAKVAAVANAEVTAKAPKASASLDARAKPTATANARVTATAPKVSVQKSASASAGTSGGGAKAGAKAGFSFGTK